MENLKKKIGEAKKIVENLDLDEPYKQEAFGAVLTQLLLGEEIPRKPKEEPKRAEPREKIKYRKGGGAFYLSRLIDETDFFKNMRTTPEIIQRIWIKFHEKIRQKDASRNFFLLVKGGKLDRDYIPPCHSFPKGMYIWFLPNTPEQEIIRYKERFRE